MEDRSLSISPARAARWLVTFQMLRAAAPAGAQNPFTDGADGPHHDLHAPGPTRSFETLMLNLLRYRDDHPCRAAG